MRPTPTPAPMARDRLLALLDRMRTMRITVLGDLMLDRYLVGDTDRLSPEAPVPVVMIRDVQARLGGAGNVAANVTAIGATCHLVALTGEDDHAGLIRTELAAAGIPDQYLVPSTTRPTTTKTRVVARGQQVVRIDEETDRLADDTEHQRLVAATHAALANADALLLQDYNKGTLTPGLITLALEAARHRGIPVIADPKFRNFFAYPGVTVFKPNRRELDAALGATLDVADPSTLPAVLAQLSADNLLLTLGAEGMLLVTREGRVTRIPSLAREVFDVSGAGDTVTAWVGTALAAGATVREAAVLATFAAGVEVGKSGVATVFPAEVLAMHEERHDLTGRLRRGGAI